MREFPSHGFYFFWKPCISLDSSVISPGPTCPELSSALHRLREGETELNSCKLSTPLILCFYALLEIILLMSKQTKEACSWKIKKHDVQSRVCSCHRTEQADSTWSVYLVYQKPTKALVRELLLCKSPWVKFAKIFEGIHLSKYRN